MTSNVRINQMVSFGNNLFRLSQGLRLVFSLLDHTGDINSLTQSLESFIVKQGLDNMIKNKDTIRQVCFSSSLSHDCVIFSIDN